MEGNGVQSADEAVFASVIDAAEEILAEASLARQVGASLETTGARAATSLRRSVMPALLGADVIALSTALVCGQLVDMAINGRGTITGSLGSLLYVPVFLVIMGCYGLYRRGRRRLIGSTFPDFGQLVHSLLVGSLGVLFVAGAAHRWLGLQILDRTGAAFTGLIALVAVTQTRAVARRAVRRLASLESSVLVVGSGVVAGSVVARLSKVEGVRVVGCVDDSINAAGKPVEGVPMLGGLSSIPGLVAEHGVDHVVVAFSPATGAELARILRSLGSGVQISVVPRLFDLLTVRSSVEDLHGLPVVDVAPPALGHADRFAKRALDVVASGAGLTLLAPVMAVIAVAVKLTSPGPALFSQERTGRRGGSFRIHKFRSMKVGAEQEQAALANEMNGPNFKIRNDPRVTPLGRFLRKTSLDELPQLINVFKGDMSLVGPRPFLSTESAGIEGWAARRFDVRPGMTGLWQVSGRNDLPFEELCRLDYSYVASWSLWWDLRILWHTPGTVFRRVGAY
jgi:exopolysaccharide biosynthesis polyprenyl glycosylphosphotransferase